MPELPSGTVTFLMTDVQGSTVLWARHPQAMDAALKRLDALADSAVVRHGGILLRHRGEGDSAFAVFARASDAVAAAVALQCGIAAETWPAETPLRVRVAVHTGEVEPRDNDYFGPDVNRCARLRAIAHGGQTLISQTTYELVRAALPEGAGMIDLGIHHLRDIERAERVYQLTHPALPSEFPPLKSLDALPNNLPRQLTSFIGREREIAEVKRLLARAPLLTLTGAGGSGKTRLALRVAAENLEAYTDGVWLVELAPVSDGAMVASAVATVLTVRDEAGRRVEDALIEHLRHRSLLLILDNCEHVLAACAQLADTLLRSSQGLRILATSRQTLGIHGETAYQVPTLSLPDTANPPPLQRLMQYEAVQLFCDRAAAALPAFEISRQNAAAVTQICRRLNGIPLAIELAAARVRALSADEIAARLDNVFTLLTGGSWIALDRHQTLRAAMDWSYELLTKAERALLSRIAVFAGGWTLDAAERVCSGDGIEPEAILDLLDRLLDKSLIVATHHETTTRYALLEPIRQYGREKLERSGEADHFRERHRDYYLDLAEEAEPHLKKRDQKTWLDRLQADHDNLRAALEWSTEPEVRLRFATALYDFWYIRGHVSEGRACLERGLAHSSGATKLRASAYNVAGILAWSAGDYEAATTALQHSLEIQQQIGDTRGAAACLNNLGLIAWSTGDLERGQAFYEASLAIWREMDDRAGIAVTLNNLGCIAVEQDDWARARPLLEQSLALQRELGDKSEIANTLLNFANAAEHSGDFAAARQLYLESLMLRRELGDRTKTPFLLLYLGDTARAQSDLERAARLYGAAASAREAVGIAWIPAKRASHERDLKQLETELGKERFQALYEQGHSLRADRAIDYALGLCDNSEESG